MLRFGQSIRLAAAALIAIASGVNASAATIESNNLDDGTTIVFLRGDIALGDEKAFANVALAHDNAIVVLQSAGGNLHAGIEIGKAIRLKGYSTYVADGESCASACALAWLGGRNRAMSATARVGFHAAHTQQGDQKTTTSVGNALVGAYASQLGLPDRAIIYVTSASPDDIKWLTFSDAQAIGIDVKQVNLNDGSGARRNASAPAQANPIPTEPSAIPVMGNWGQYGDWIQIFSRPILLEATQLATEYKSKFDNTFVFRFANGWYAVLIGPFPFGTGVQQKNAMVASGAIPADSLIAKPDRIGELVFGGRPNTALAQTSGIGGPEIRARSFMTNFHARWSMDNDMALSGLDGFYADAITYYGKPSAKSTVMTEKRQFAVRWPDRSYTVRPDTITAACTDRGECTVAALIDWRVSSATRGAVSTGSARYELQLRFDGARTMIIGENGTVLSRQTNRN